MGNKQSRSKSSDSLKTKKKSSSKESASKASLSEGDVAKPADKLPEDSKSPTKDVAPSPVETTQHAAKGDENSKVDELPKPVEASEPSPPKATAAEKFEATSTPAIVTAPAEVKAPEPEAKAPAPEMVVEVKAPEVKAPEVKAPEPEVSPTPTTPAVAFNKLPTLANPPRIPRLPLPKLEDTLTRYLKAVEPLLTAEEKESTQAAVQNLLENDGPRLHAELQKLAEGSGYPESWIEGFWDDMYLCGRWPLPINSNPMVMFAVDEAHKTQLSRATVLTYSSIKFAYKVLSKTLEISFVGKTPLDSFQFTRMFASTRVPLLSRDAIVPKQSDTFDHIVVFHGARLYKFDVLDRKTGRMIEQSTLEKHLEAILSNEPRDTPAIGYFTVTDRDTWANNRVVMLEDETSAATIKAIDESLFIVCLDAGQTSLSYSETPQSFLHGRPGSQPLDRWFDKPISLLVSRDGNAAINFEHSWGDGIPIARYLHETFCDSQGRPSGFAPLVGTEKNGVLPESESMQELLFNVDVATPLLQAAVDSYTAFSNSLNTAELEFFDYGKNAIKACKMSPDSLVQMSFQLAYYRLYKKVVSTYEAATMAQFHHGRTEAIRPLTLESSRFVEQFDQAEPQEQLKLLSDAIAAHSSVAELAKTGTWIDRHLLGLLSIAKRDGVTVPAVFTEPAYSKYTANILSTSTVPITFVARALFGPVHADGYGICYLTVDDKILMTVSAFSTSTTNVGSAKFLEQVQLVLKDFAKLFALVARS